MRLLLVEDDRELCSVMALCLREAGYETDCCYDGEEAYFYMKDTPYDVVILDRMLPGLDGLSLLEKIRREGSLTPVILLTALGALHDRIDGLDAGADDYITKPFETEELMARIRALLRRPRSMGRAESVSYGDLYLEINQLTVQCRDKEKVLSKKEAELLEYMMRNGGQILSREQILSRVWGVDAQVENGNIDNYIYFLRRKIKAMESELEIKAVHGVGYRLQGRKEMDV